MVALDQLPPLGGGGYIDEPTRASIQSYADSHPDTYAGQFNAQGHMYVGFTEDAAGNLRALRSRVADPSLVRAFTARYTYRQLIQLRDRILADRSWFKANGIQLETWGPDDYHNRELIGLLRLDWWWMTEIGFRYGFGMLRFEQWGPSTGAAA